VPRRAGECSEEGLRIVASALETGTMARGERRRLVEKEELGVSVAPHLASSALEFAAAGDPAFRCPAPRTQRPVVAMKPAAPIAHKRSPRDRCGNHTPSGSIFHDLRLSGRSPSPLTGARGRER